MLAGTVPPVSAPLVHHGPGTAQGCSGSGRIHPTMATAQGGQRLHPTQPWKGSFTGIAASLGEPWEAGAREGSVAPAPRFSWKPPCFLLAPSSCFVSVPISSLTHRSSTSYLFISSNGISLQVAEQLK